MLKSPRLLSICLALMGLHILPEAYAAMLTVSNTADSGEGSLRAQVAAATSGDTIDFSVTGVITLSTGVIAISKDLTITGPGADNLTVRGINSDGPRSIFNISVGDVGISGLTLANGYGTFFSAAVGGVTSSVRSGGALYITGGTVMLENSTLSGNRGTLGLGGAIFMTGGTLTVSGSTFSGNSADKGGAVYLSGDAVATITTSTLSSNSATSGGAVFTTGASAAVMIRSSTLSGNSAQTGGGVLINSGPLTITNSTISGNAATGTGNGHGGGIFCGGAATITNSTITRNTGGTNSTGGFYGGAVTMSNTIVSGNFGSASPNVISTTAITGTNNIIGPDPMLALLANNGGPTRTHALLAGSPAIDTGDQNFDITATPYDQRGFVFLRKSSSAIDIGAYEVQVAADTTPPTISISAPSITLADASSTVTYTVTYSDANFSSSSLSASNVTLNRSGSINASVSLTSGSINTRTVTLNGINGYGTLGITIVAGTATDSSGNTAPAAGPGSTFIVNPSVETVRDSGTMRPAAGGGYVIDYIGNPGQTYTILFSPDLQPPWQTLQTQVADPSGLISIIDHLPVGITRRFYRLDLP